MKLNDFKVEQWMTAYEKQAIWNLTDTCVHPFSLAELFRMDTHDILNEVVLDYGSITGDIQFKEEILKIYQTGTIDNITTAVGCSQANELVMYEFLDPGDHVITFSPGYEQFSGIPKSIGCDVTVLPLYEEDEWQPHIEDVIAAINDHTKMIMINNPNNPTGTLYDPKFIDKLISLAKDKNIYILSDEVYAVPDNTRISDQYEKGISTGSLSKIYSLAGLRLGWIKADTEIINRINKRRDYSIISVGPFSEKLGIIALQHSSTILERTDTIIQENVNTVKQWLSQEDRADIVFPKGGTVAFLHYDIPMHSKELSLQLLKEYGVFFVPGWCFDCEYHLRLGLTQEKGVLENGLQLFSQFMDEHENDPEVL